MTTIDVRRGDLTTESVDAIVNAANSSLLGGGGVDGAIHRAAGPSLLAECRQLRAGAYADGLAVGDAVATGGGDLPCRFVIHTVGPNRHAGQTDPDLLASCFTRSLAVAAEVEARTIAFPAVSAGVYGWAPAQVARTAVGAIRAAPDLEAFDLVRFTLFSDELLWEFESALARSPGGTGPHHTP